MCFGGSDTQSSTQVTNTSLPAWAQNEAQGQIGMANNIAGQPWQQYPNARMADWTPDMTTAANATRGMAFDYMPAMSWSTGATQAAGNAALGEAGFNAPQVGAQGWQDFMNPHMDAITAAIQRQGSQQRNAIDRQAIARGAYGSNSRDILQGRQREGEGRAIGELASGAFNTAMGQNLQAQGANQNAAIQSLAGRLSALKTGMEGANQTGALTQLMQQMKGTDINALMGLGGAQRADAQKLLDLALGDWQEQRDWPLRGLNIRSSTLRGTPMPTSSTSTTTGPGANSAASNVGLGIGGAGLLYQMLGSPNLLKAFG